MKVHRILLIAAAALPCVAGDWNPRLAADYLDARQKQWSTWKMAELPGGACVSCHGGISYLLSRPALRRTLHESPDATFEPALIEGLKTRVGMEAKAIAPSFANKDPHINRALGVESVEAALFLALNDAEKKTWSSATEKAFDRLWATQIKEGDAAGAWEWFAFNLDPWEMPHSKYFGATLAAMAIGTAPAEYRKKPDVADHIGALVHYLKTNEAKQPLHHRLMLVWASSKLPAVMEVQDRKEILAQLTKNQQEDGGWSIASLGPWVERTTAPPSPGSHAYATAIVALTLESAGVKRSDARLERALNWLKSHQDAADGSWAAVSMNKKFEPNSIPDGFMREAATAYAALALVQ